MPIEIEYLSFSYGAREILHDISLAIPDRTLVNVLGPNGVGSDAVPMHPVPQCQLHRNDHG